MIRVDSQIVHSNIGNAPRLITVIASHALPGNRHFTGTGAPAVGTLLAGNGKYNGVNSGWVVNASLINGGLGYDVGDPLTDNTIIIDADEVSATGVITRWHVSNQAFYAAYPANPFTDPGGASFSLNFPAPDYYYDVTTPAAPVPYMCAVGGNNSTSKWIQLGTGSGGYMGEYNVALSYSAGQWVKKTIGTNLGFYAVPPGKTALAGQAPTFPVDPAGPWDCVGLPFQTIGVCSGGQKNVFVQATAPF